MPSSPDGARRSGAHLPLTAQARVVGVARRFAVQETAALGGDDAAQDTVRTLVSELVTNLVLHAGTEGVLRVLDAADAVRVEVLDGSPAVPQQRRVDGSSTTGRGLRLLRTLAEASGIDRDDTVAAGGKVVWFTVAKRRTRAADDAVAAAALELFGVDLRDGGRP